MPVEFLSDEQVGAYGRFTGELSAAEVERFFYLDDADRNLIARRRSDHHRLGFAVQLGTVRAVGRFLEDPLDVPWPQGGGQSSKPWQLTCTDYPGWTSARVSGMPAG